MVYLFVCFHSFHVCRNKPHPQLLIRTSAAVRTEERVISSVLVHFSSKSAAACLDTEVQSASFLNKIISEAEHSYELNMSYDNDYYF